jgi:hypothetical protein
MLENSPFTLDRYNGSCYAFRGYDTKFEKVFDYHSVIADLAMS